MIDYYVVRDLGNSDRPEMLCYSEEEVLRVVVALSAATHGRWAASRLNGAGQHVERYGVWGNGKRES